MEKKQDGHERISSTETPNILTGFQIPSITYAMKHFCTILLSLLSLPLFSQAYEGNPCAMYENPTLKKQIDAGFIPSIRFNGMEVYSNLQSWATSSLKPDTKKPTPNKGEEDYEHKERVDAWTCMYTPFAISDYDTKTAWVEGAKDDGIGETVFVRLDSSKPVLIWAGYGKSQGLFEANGRPKKIKVTVWAGKKGEDPGAQWETFDASNIKAIASHEIELVDKNNYQPLPLPKHSLKPDDTFTLVSVTILSVYKGKKYPDTAISEIKNKD